MRLIACLNGWHSITKEEKFDDHLQALLKEMFSDEHADRVLSELRQSDEERLSAALQAAAQNAASDIGPEAITALFEVLSFEALMDDAAVMAAVEAALLTLSEHHDLALSEGGRYPGLYRLLAHSSQPVRSLVSIHQMGQ